MEITGAGSSNNSIGGTEQRPGITVLDPTTNKTTTLLNNYFGSYHNGLDDLFVDPHDDIWFTDPDYAWNGNRTDTTPQLHAQTYRFPSFPPVNSGWLKIHSVNPMASPSPLMPKTFTFAILSLAVVLFLRIILTSTLCLIIRLSHHDCICNLDLSPNNFTNPILRRHLLHLPSPSPFRISNQWRTLNLPSPNSGKYPYRVSLMMRHLPRNPRCWLAYPALHAFHTSIIPPSTIRSSSNRAVRPFL